MGNVKFLWGCVLGVALLGTTFANAENILKNGDGENAQSVALWGGNTVQNTKEKKAGNASMESNFANGSWALSPEFIEIDPAKTYKVSGFFKAGDNNPRLKLFLSTYFYKADKTSINPYSVLPTADTAAVLREELKSTDTVLKIEKNDSWKMVKGLLYAVVFNAKGDLSDLPNPEFAPISKIEEKDSMLEITFPKPIGRNYPAGTKIRMHRYLDPASKSIELNSEDWTECSFVINDKNIYPGTKFFKLIVYTPEKGRTLLFDEIKIEEVK